MPKVSLEGRRNGREREEEGRERGGEEKERRGEGKEGRGEWKERVGEGERVKGRKGDVTMVQLRTRPAYSREVFAWQSALHSTTLVFQLLPRTSLWR